MSTTHQKMYLRFKRIVDGRRRAAAKIDIRRFIDQVASDEITFGYLSRNFKRSYPANLIKLFPNCKGFDHRTANESSYAMIPRAPVDNEKLDPHVGTETLLDAFKNDDGILFLEQGFIASAASWSHSFREQNIQYACLSYMFDDLAFYYMAEYENRLTQKLNSDEVLDEAQRIRAGKLIEAITTHRISKYNSQPDYTPAIGSCSRPKVLVIDQSYGDSSTHYGLADDRVFEDMLLAAIRENPEADVIVKTHPDSIYEKATRAGYFSGLRNFENVYFFREPVNPYSLFDIVEKVYVATSGVGLEALLAGKPVVCFGAPFYAGWGLTDDRQMVPHRRRQRDLQDVFYYTYVWYTRYFTPVSEGECEIEEVIDYVLRYRPTHPPHDLPSSENSVRLSVIIPAYNSEKYIAQCLESILEQSLSALEVIVVNDASTDSTLEIINQHLAQDNRIKCINLDKNIGQGFARNQALGLACGDYVLFLDSDDFLVDSSVLESGYMVAASCRADMARMRKAYEQLEDAEGRQLGIRDDPSERYFDESFGDTRFEFFPSLLQNRHFWTFLYRREFLLDNDIRFIIPQWEERPFLTKSLLTAEKIVDTGVKAVVYRVRKDSTARRIKNTRDLELQLINYRETLKLVTISGDEDYLKFAKGFVSTQIIQAVFFGWFWDTLDSLPEVAFADYAGRLKDFFLTSGISSQELSAEPYNVNKARFDRCEYHLLLEYAAEGRWQDVRRLLGGARFDAVDFYHDMLSDNSRLSCAANKFAKYSNDRLEYGKAGGTNLQRPKLILHIGSTKTGSTFIQHFCDLNRSQLLDQGMWFPEFGQFWQEGRTHKQAGHSEFIHAAHKQDPEFKDRLCAGTALTGRQVNTVLLSSEAFFLVENPEVILNYFCEFEVAVVVYLRPQYEWARSQYAEFVAGGAIGKITESFEDWVGSELTVSRLEYDRKLDAWARLIGRKNIQVRQYGPQYFEGDSLVDDFLGAVNINMGEQFQFPESNHENRSVLSSRHLPLMRVLNRYAFASTADYFQFVSKVEQKLASLANTSNDEDRASEIFAQLSDRCEAGNAYIADKYLGDPSRPLFQDFNWGRDEVSERDMSIPVREAEAILDAFLISGARYSGPSDNAVSFPGEESLFNLGYFAWRRQFKRLVRHLYKDRLSEHELALFDKDISRLLAETGSMKLRMVCLYFHSRGAVYGVFQWRKLLTPYVAKIILKFWGPEKHDEFVKNPVAFVRYHKKTVLVVLGRILYPMGELNP